MNRFHKRRGPLPLVQAKRSSRLGVAAVEFAAVLPVLLLLITGSLEMARAVMVSHALQETSQSACRVFSVAGTTMAEATAIVDDSMANAGISNYTTEFDPKKKGDVDKTMMEVTVTISVPFADVAWLPPTFMAGAILEGRSLLPADLEVGDGGDQDGYRLIDDDYEGDGYVRHNDAANDDD